MRLPNAEEAIVDERKLREYCLSREHPRGRHKARVFASELGLSAEDSHEVALALKRAATENDSLPGISDFYGDRYIIDFIWRRTGREATVRSIWIVLREESVPRFVSCFIP